MLSPLLTTKLYPPQMRPALVSRPRLIQRLADGLKRPLTLVAAPAGFGKSTLVAEWRATEAGRAAGLAWVSLDPGDNDPARFWGYVMGALRTLPPLAGLPEEVEASAPPELLLAPLVNGLQAAAGPVVLVLDDYHVIDTPGIHAAVAFLVEHMPPALRLVVLSRADPPWPMARLRAHGLMADLRAADLRFTPGEAARLFAATALSDAHLGVIAERTEGWAAALQMVALSLQGHPDPQGFVASFTGENRYITDYLTEEVLARQPEELRRFLLHASVLERLNGPLCAAVTGMADSRTLLDQAERKGLFLTALDPTRQWFRLHHLFGDLLRAYLQETEPDLVPELHRRAAAWLGSNGQPLDAARHALAARDYAHVLALVEQHAEGWWAMASPGFSRLLAHLPPDVARRSPLICTYQAWITCLMGHLKGALDWIAAAEQHAQLPPSTRSLFALMRAFIAEQAGEAAPLTDAILQAPAAIPEQGDGGFRNAADLALAHLLCRNARLDLAATLLQQVTERELARGTTYAIPVAIPLLAEIRLIEGRPAEAADLCRRYLAVVQERGEGRFPLWGNLRAALADALLTQGDLEAAETEAREGLKANAAFDVYHAPVMPLHALARVRLARGAPQEALDLLEQEEAATRGRNLAPDLVAAREAIRVQVWLTLGRLDLARGWAQGCGLGVHDPLSYRQEVRHMTLVRVLLATGRQTEAATLAGRLARAAEATGRGGRLAEIRRLVRPQSAVHLSEREQEILRLIAAGRSNQEIARELVVAVGTVKIHVHNLFQKLEVQSRTQAVARGRELGILSE